MKPKVLHISKFYPPDIGGIESFVGDLVNNISQKIVCDVLCFNKKNKTIIEKKRFYKIIRTATLGSFFSVPISFSLIFFLKKIHKKYNILHLHLPNPIATLAVFLVRPKSKIIIHWHSDIVKQRKLFFLYSFLQNWILKKADKIIVTSPQYLNTSPDLKNNIRKCVMIPLGVDPVRLKYDREEVEKIKKTYKGKPIIFSLGRFVYYKGFDYLIKAMSVIDGYLLIGGTGPLEKKIRKLIKDMKLEKKVVLLGHIETTKIANYYKACDIFCLPSVERSEAFGIVQVEAMSFAKPVVSTNIYGSGVSFVNQNNLTGLVVKPKDFDSLAWAINKIIKNEKLKKIFGKRAKERFNEKFHIKKIAKEILNLYKKVLN